MLQNAYLLAKIGADTAENERNFADYLLKIGKLLARADESISGTCAAGCDPFAGWGVQF